MDDPPPVEVVVLEPEEEEETWEMRPPWTLAGAVVLRPLAAAWKASKVLFTLRRTLVSYLFSW